MFSWVQRVGKTAKNFRKKYYVNISGYSLFCHNHRLKNFFFKCDFLFSF